MDNKLELLTTRDFNGHTLDCYVAPDQQDKSDFWATREQIGQMLGYKRPRHAIANIHDRYRKRLDKFSGVLNLSTPSGTQATTVYSFRGLLEICRYSQQPVANAVIDKLWDIAEEIRRTGMYVTTQAVRRLEERVAELEKQVQADYPVKLLGSIVLARPESITFQSAAQFLAEHGIKTGQNRLYKKCRDKKLICRREGRQKNMPSQRAIEEGLFELSIRNGFKPVTMITPKGLQFLAQMLTREQYPMLLLMADAEED